MYLCMKQNTVEKSSLATEERGANESSEIGGLMDIMDSMSGAVPCRADSSPRDIKFWKPRAETSEYVVTRISSPTVLY